MLGHALALRAGMSYEALVESRITLPLEIDTRPATGYAPTLQPAVNWDLPTLAGAVLCAPPATTGSRFCLPR